MNFPLRSPLRRGLRLLSYALAALLVGVGAILWLILKPLPLPEGGMSYTVPVGASIHRVATDLAKQGVLLHPWQLLAAAKLNASPQAIRAGEYALNGALNVFDLLEELRSGKHRLANVTLVEGQTLKQWLTQLSTHADLKQPEGGLTMELLTKALEMNEDELEGGFFPDSYRFAAGTDALVILRMAAKRMKDEVAKIWAQRAPDLPFSEPREAVVLASIIEKETGRRSDRPNVASVFVNRLRLGMRLQADPTVIYGLGDSFDGNITKRDLRTDTPYNSYTRVGLPPTPIAMPGRASLLAAVNPAKTDYVFFVARGDGTSEFTATLAAHNRAVQKYQLGGAQ